MEVILTNPAGLWALLGIPAVIAIHFLQQQSREILISTRFLLEQMQKESVEGRKLDRLRSSIPLWLQLLAVLALTWLLIGPRWKRADSVQRTAVVLDSSASMLAFKENLTPKLTPILRDLAANASQAEFVVIASHLESENLYHGADLDELLASLDAWQPLRGKHDVAPALQVAHSLVGKDGTIILVTDHLADSLPFNARLLAIGNPVANCGFTGLRILEENGQARWRVIARNYSDQTLTRSWHLEAAGKKSPPQSVTLEPRQTVALQGAFPPGAEACTIHLEPDAFPLDDRLPVVRATPKKLTVRRSANPSYDDLYDTVLASLKNTGPPADESPPDITFATYDPLNPFLPETNAVVGIAQRLAEKSVVQGPVVAKNHELMADLNWQSLVCRSSMTMPAQNPDNVLLWQGKRPLISLRTTGAYRQLLFNFDLSASNVDRLPAFIILLHRFAESIREKKFALESLNAETAQPLQIAAITNPDAPPVVLKTMQPGGAKMKSFSPAQAASLRAPLEPAFFHISQGDTELVRGASHFADTREADFQSAASANRVDQLDPALVERHTRDDPYWRIAVVLLGALLLLNWFFSIRRPTSPPSPAPATQ